MLRDAWCPEKLTGKYRGRILLNNQRGRDVFYIRHEGQLIRNRRLGFQWFLGPRLLFRWGRHKFSLGWLRWKPYFWYQRIPNHYQLND